GGLSLQRDRRNPGDPDGHGQIPHCPWHRPTPGHYGQERRGSRPGEKTNGMNSDEAKNILLLYRPGRADPGDGHVGEALEQAERDPELHRWFEQTSRFHEALSEKFQQIPVPSDLKYAILARRRIVQPLWWQQPVWMAAAAVIVLLLSLAAFWLQQPRA